MEETFCCIECSIRFIEKSEPFEGTYQLRPHRCQDCRKKWLKRLRHKYFTRTVDLRMDVIPILTIQQARHMRRAAEMKKKAIVQLEHNEKMNRRLKNMRLSMSDPRDSEGPAGS